jgi:hypothetical protein
MLFKSILLLLIVAPIFSIGQTNTNNPFSSRGIGEMNPLTHPIFGALGNVSTALIDSAQLNSENPSSYSFLGKGQPIFSVGIASNFSTFKQQSITSASHFISLNYFTLGMALSQRFGICFGLKPYSSTGYHLKSSKISGTDTLNYDFTGNGGFSNAYFGLSVKILHRHKHHISIGSNFGYVFGTNLNEITTTLSSATLGGIRDKSIQIKAMNIDLGISYLYRIASDHDLVIGATLTPSQSFASTYTNSLIYAFSTTNVLGNDTLKSTIINNNIQTPSIISLGFKYDFTKKNKEINNSNKSPQLQISGELKLTNWNSYNNPLLGNNETFKNTIQYGVGFQYAPHFDFLDRSKDINLIHRMKYRVGAIYQTLPWSDQQVQLSNKALTFGIGIPIINQFSSSSINLSCLYGQRWNGIESTLKENYFSFNFGVNITPASYERWFKKNKID